MKQFVANNYYHLYNRGVNRQNIFFRARNYRFFIQRLRHYFAPTLVGIIAYCLMPNHYHLLVYVKTDNELSKRVMQPFGTSYTKAINVQEKRVGPLFQGWFKGKLVDDRRYLHHLTRYVHLNPVEAGLVEKPEEWPYSSYLDYVGFRQGTLPKMEAVLSRFESPAAYRAFVDDAADVMKSWPLIRGLLIEQ